MRTPENKLDEKLCQDRMEYLTRRQLEIEELKNRRENRKFAISLVLSTVALVISTVVNLDIIAAWF